MRETNDDRVVVSHSAAAAFDTRRTGERKCDIEISGFAMRLTRNCNNGRDGLGHDEELNRNDLRASICARRLNGGLTGVFPNCHARCIDGYLKVVWGRTGG